MASTPECTPSNPDIPTTDDIRWQDYFDHDHSSNPSLSEFSREFEQYCHKAATNTFIPHEFPEYQDFPLMILMGRRRLPLQLCRCHQRPKKRGRPRKLRRRIFRYHPDDENQVQVHQASQIDERHYQCWKQLIPPSALQHAQWLGTQSHAIVKFARSS